MKQDKKILHDISKLASSAFSSAAGAKREFSAYIHGQIEEFLRGMNFVRREEFEALHKLTLSTSQRIDAIENPSSSAKKEKSSTPKIKQKKSAHLHQGVLK